MTTLLPSIDEPRLPPDSPGSSVSSRLQEEYDELLKYAVVIPTYDIHHVPQSLIDTRSAFYRPSGTAETRAQGDTERPRPVDDKPPQKSSETVDDNWRQQRRYDDGDNGNRKSDVSGGSTPIPFGDGQQDMRGMSSARDEFAAPGEMFRTQDKPSMDTRLFPSGSATADRPLSPTPSSSSRYSSEIIGGSHDVYTSAVDEDMVRMEGLLEQWSAELKKRVLAEYGRAKVQWLERMRSDMLKVKEKHALDINRSQDEIESQKELLNTYEQSIGRKDQVVANLTSGLSKQREKAELLKMFSEWKLKHNDVKREAFASNLARKHYEHTIQRRCWDAWHSIIEMRWRQRVEKACQAKAQEVCIELTNDYETRIASLNEALETSRREVTRLHTERENYEDTMKKAFMRGVCALNLEAMSMFHEPSASNEEKGSNDAQAQSGRVRDFYDYDGHVGGATIEEGDRYSAHPTTYSQEAMYTSEPPGGPPLPRVVTSLGGVTHGTQGPSIAVQGSSLAPSKIRPASRGKVITAKVSARVDSGRGTTGGHGIQGGIGPFVPPMTSVVVEKHPPLKATGQATGVSRYPAVCIAGLPAQHLQPFVAQPQQQVTFQRKLTGSGLNVAPNIQTVRLVE